MNMNSALAETLKDASDDEIRDFILATLIELLDLAALLHENKKLRH